MRSSITKLAALAVLTASTVLASSPTTGGCDYMGHPEYTAYNSCLNDYDVSTMPACAYTAFSTREEECSCTQFTRQYSCASSACGSSAIQADKWLRSMESCASAGFGAMVTTAGSGSSGKGVTSATLTSGATGSAALASQTSSAEAGALRGHKEVVVVVLAGVAGALI